MPIPGPRIRRSYGHLVLLPALMASSMAGCGSDGADAAAAVEFPAGRSGRATHCHTVLELRTQQLSDVAGEGRLADWVASDYARAKAAALEAVPPSAVQGDFDALRERVGEVMAAFDANSDRRIDGEDELEEFSRHVDLCMREFSPES
jgi:hypothetical protein